VSIDGSAYLTNIAYNARGQRTDVWFANGSKTRYEYDSDTFRLTRLLTTRNSGVDVLQDITYTYDPEGNITQQSDAAQQTYYFNNSVVSPTGLYEYDALYRLIKAQGRELTNLGMATESDFVNTLLVPNAGSNAMQNYTQMFSYDELGNLQMMQSQGRWSRSYIYDNVTNRLIRHEGTNNVYTYDAHGNMISMPHLSSMTWNSSDMLRSATNGTFTSYYSYNAAGDRVRKVIEKGNIREERLYLGNYERYRKYVNNILKIERQTVHIIDDRHRFALIDRLTIDNGITLSTATNSIRYQYDNHLGSASLELDQTAAIISYEEYHPFGTTSYRSGRTETEVSQKRYKYVGKERDEETGLYYYGARYYAGWLCRFVSVDPAAEKYVSLTPYHYCANNPINAIDPDGQKVLFVNGYYNTGNGTMPKGIAKNIIGTVGGQGYWGKELIEAAKIFFNDKNASFIDGSGAWNSTGAERFSSGYEYAKANYTSITQGVFDANGVQSETIKVVSHSMGSAYSEGMIKYLQEQGVNVETVVHLSAADPSGFKASSAPNTLQLNLENDAVLMYKNFGENNMISGVDRFGVVNTSRNFISDYMNSHADTKIYASTFNMVGDLQNIQMSQIGNTVSTPFCTFSGPSNMYNSTENSNGTQFNLLNLNGILFNNSGTNEYKGPFKY
jgi:RHS repeat-associated protein